MLSSQRLEVTGRELSAMAVTFEPNRISWARFSDDEIPKEIRAFQKSLSNDDVIHLAE